MRAPRLTKAFLVFSICTVCQAAIAQVTTATISGTVTGADGKPLNGATVQITFADAGINKLTTTQSNGTFVVPNLRVGGPYKVTATFTGYQEKSEDNILLELGRNTPVDIRLETSTVNLEAIVVTGRSAIFR
jgi:hypothetical protein